MLAEKDLHSYQAFGVRHIVDNAGAGLLLDMGLGKTVITLSAIKELLDCMEVSRVYVVGPKRVVESVWQQEALKWSHTKDLSFSLVAGTAAKRLKALDVEADIYLVSRDNVPWLVELFGGSMLPCDMLVLDELSSFKNHQSQRFKALKRVRKSIGRVIGLTGTPAPNGLIDLFAQVFLLDGGERLGSSIGRFRTEYFKPDARNGSMVYSYKLSDEKQADRIYKAIGDICISMKAEDYLDMPDKIIIDELIEFPAKEAKGYKDFEEELVLSLISELGEGQDISADNAAALSTKLRQYTNGAIYDEERRVHWLHDLKLDRLEEIVEATNGKPLLVAVSFLHDKARLMARFGKRGARLLDSQADIDDWNKGSVSMLILHPASGGHGLNIQYGSNYIVWFGLNWSSELYNQLIARLYRQGQRAKQVFIYRLLIPGTVDMKVAASLVNKIETESDLMDGVKANPGPLEFIKELITKYKKP